MDENQEAQQEESPTSDWRGLFARIVGFRVTKHRFETLEKSITVWAAILAILAAVAKYYDRNIGALYISLAGAVALLIGLNFFIRHRTFNKRRINWPVFLPLVAVHFTLLGLGMASVQHVITSPHKPTLLTLWGTDFLSHGVKTEVGHSNYPSDDDEKVRYFYRLVQEMDQQSKFLTLFIPQTPYAKEISASVAEHLSDYLTPHDYTSGQAVGNAYPVDNLHLKFTGVVIIYHDGALTPDDLAAIHAIFARVGATAQFRGMDYAESVGEGVLKGVLRQPPDIEIQNGVACRVTPRTTPGATMKDGTLYVPQGEDFTEGALVGVPYRCKPPTSIIP